MGTGTNACYREKTGNIVKLKEIIKADESRYDKSHMLINTEWGGFIGFPDTEEDIEVKKESLHPEDQPFEKKVSGKYLEVLVRKCLQKSIKKKFILKNLTEKKAV